MIRYLVPESPALLSRPLWQAAGLFVGRALRYRKQYSVGVAWVSLAQMRVLNRQYRKKDRPTDVLSFEPIDPQEKRDAYLGDLVICPDYAKVEAKRRGLSTSEEILRLVIHGTLHLAGYDHATQSDEEKMFGVQERALSRILEVCKRPS
ncbi:rRNA maturation RNase YbeY [Patescibacteria group bacterium]|nr:rRNA maturation RNase YbeY [Patescibacteria group bacterium]